MSTPSNKQPNSRMCFVCGTQNLVGLKTAFYDQPDGSVLARVTGREQHQGYPGRMHGGVISGIMDEVIGRAIMVGLAPGEEVWGVTAELDVRFRKAVPLDVELTAVGRITRNTRLLFEGTGQLRLPDGSVAAEATGKYIKLPPQKIADFDDQTLGWRVVPDEPVSAPAGTGGQAPDDPGAAPASAPPRECSETITGIDHIAVVVQDLDDALTVFRDTLGLPLSEIRAIEGQGVRIAVLPVGQSQLELLEPMGDDTGVAKFLASRGEGMHHICLEVDDIDAALERLKAKGLRLINETAVPGAHGRVAFVHPKATHGVLVELVQRSE